MQEVFVGTWASESHLSAEILGSLHDLNHRFLELTAAGPVAASPLLAAQLAALSPLQRAAAAQCPYALFDLRFEDDGHWRSRLQNPGHWRVGDENSVAGEAVNFVRLALFFAWHVASSAGLAAQLLLGMNGDTAAAFHRITLKDLPALVATEAANLAVRWNDCNPYWSALTCAASRPDGRALRRVQLCGLQLAAAAKLPHRSGRTWSELPLRAGPREV